MREQVQAKLGAEGLPDTPENEQDLIPRFSIIMPTFRREHVIFRTIDSILHQTLSNWELIVVDNGDAGYEFSDARIRYFSFTERRGASHARNYGIGRTRGELTCFFDDDDVMHPRYLEAFHVAFKDSTVMMAHCGMLTGKERNTVNFSYATPEVVIRSKYVKPNWDSGDCHDQRYFRHLADANRWSGAQITRLDEILVTATCDPQGGLRDSGGMF